MINLRLSRALTAAAMSVALGASAAANTSATAAGGFQLTNADNGRTLQLQPGDTARVNLRAVQGEGVVWVWSRPTTDLPAVLQRTAASTTPSGDAVAAFDADEPGSATITAAMRCQVVTPGAQCPMAVKRWRVDVVVQ